MSDMKRMIKCPYCHIFSQQEYYEYHFNEDFISTGGVPQIKDRLELRRCSHCGGKFFYINNKLMYPEPEVIAPVKDMPEDVKNLFEEAASISHRSPRAACALLRLAIEILCTHLNADGNTIDAKITSLVKRGLSKEIQEALDVVRVVGNNAVHPGQISFDVDDESTANMLFNLLNIIVERLICEPAAINRLYEQLPEATKDHISKRNKRS